MNLLSDPEVLLLRARTHIDELKLASEEFIKQDHWSCLLESEEGAVPVIFRFNVIEQPPIEIGASIGEIVNNLRSSLDHLVWQLALVERGGQTPTRHTEFPIRLDVTRETFFGAVGKALKHVSLEVREVIETLQPYHRQDWSGVDRLRVLNDLVNTAKHQTIVPLMGVGRIETNTGQTIRLGPVSHGQTFTLVPNSDSDIDLGVMTSIGVVVDELAGLAGPQTFGSAGFLLIHDFIKSDVFPRLMPYLSRG